MDPHEHPTGGQTIPQSEPPRLKPVTETQRIDLVDTLRGFALLGILVMNITLFSMPMETMFNPMLLGDFTGINQTTWLVKFFVFSTKMMAIFSMLFGAGIVLMHNRAVELGKTSFAGIWYKRIFWLWIAGLIHALFIWEGDILFTYAICGIFLYPVRKLRPGWLLVLGAVVLLIGIGISYGSGLMFKYMEESYAAVQAAEETGEEPTEMQITMAQAWEEARVGFEPSEEQLAEIVEKRRGSYGEMFQFFWLRSLAQITQGAIFFLFWRALGLMLIGMALMKLGMFSGSWSFRTYAILIIIGYGIAMPISAYGGGQLIAHEFSIGYYFADGMFYDYFPSIFVSLAHVSLIVIIYRLGWLHWLMKRMSAVGRMAFTNYLMQSIMLTTVFYGFGLGLYGRFERFELLAFVLAVWIIEIAWSQPWLAKFKFGPFEWLWRSLTYGKPQPMKRG